ncbi:MAG TPA: hypothetical protein VFA69_06360 [Candidatus Nitrosotalea sp.]|nr:hypothetical protein [Candidatus Nitrosotalea sp.]
MRLFAIISLVTLLVTLYFFSSHDATAEVWIPDNEYKGYYNSDGIYTVVGAVKNTENYPITPNIIINVNDSGQVISESHTLAVVNASKDIPFKIMLPQVKNKNAVLEKPQVSFEESQYNASSIEVTYGRTLIKHKDGHTTGFIVNTGTLPAYNVKVYAVIYGKDGKFLDVGKSVENITKMNPGEKIAFSMYPDPQYASKISYYSCFNMDANGVQAWSAERKGEQFHFNVLTSGAISDPRFSDSGQTLAVTVRYPFPDTGFVNFMFPVESDNQKFSISSDGKPIQFIQSKDPDGYWHVALNLASRSNAHLEITGFGSDQTLPVGNLRDYLLVIIPIAAAIASIIIWKKKKD